MVKSKECIKVLEKERGFQSDSLQKSKPSLGITGRATGGYGDSVAVHGHY